MYCHRIFLGSICFNKKTGAKDKMSVRINMRKNDSGTALPAALSKILPYKLYGELIKKLPTLGRIEEIRCRTNCRAFITSASGNVELSYIPEKADMEAMTDKLCGGSLYAHRDTLTEGYVTVEGGIRVGVCGRAAVEGGRIIGIYDVSSLNFRLPSAVFFLGEPVERLLRQGGGALVYSPPGVGKTTLLRSVARRMSSGACPIRVCVIDTRGELSAGLEIGNTADILLGYPKGKGIEIATRTMNPQLIICDEIGDDREADAILSAQNSGVPLLASAHADSAHSLLRRRGIRLLHDSGVFSHYVGISRSGGELHYDICARSEVNACV